MANLSFEGFCYTHPNITINDVEHFKGHWAYIISSLAFFVSGTLGNTLLFGILHYERFGGDPQKRSVRNRMASEMVVCVASLSNLSIVMFLGEMALSLDASVKLTDICIRLQRQDTLLSTVLVKSI